MTQARIRESDIKSDWDSDSALSQEVFKDDQDWKRNIYADLLDLNIGRDPVSE